MLNWLNLFTKHTFCLTNIRWTEAGPLDMLETWLLQNCIKQSRVSNFNNMNTHWILGWFKNVFIYTFMWNTFPTFKGMTLFLSPVNNISQKNEIYTYQFVSVICMQKFVSHIFHHATQTKGHAKAQSNAIHIAHDACKLPGQ